jgi:uncharacterized protein (TIGR02757 family)
VNLNPLYLKNLHSPQLKEYLEKLYRQYNPSFLSKDPLEFVHRFQDPRDQEIVGLLASCLAYGNVKQIRASVQKILAVLGEKPYHYVITFNPELQGADFDQFVHRFTQGKDIVCLVYLLRQVLLKHGSLGNYFLQGYSAREKTIRSALTRFVEGLLRLPFPGGYIRQNRISEGIWYLLPSPASGSACKRLNLFLRWMVRRGDQLDLGLWVEVSPRQLVVPLDVHVGRIARNLGLTTRKTDDWKTAEEITDRLRMFDPEDPVKYDFALSHMGISGDLIG